MEYVMTKVNIFSRSDSTKPQDFFNLLWGQFPPIVFLKSQQKKLCAIFVKGKRVRAVLFTDISHISNHDGKLYIHYKKRDKNGQVCCVRTGPIANDFEENVLKPFSQYKEFCDLISQVAKLLHSHPNDQQDGLSALLKDFCAIKAQKIEAVKRQSFEEAVQFREAEKEAASVILACLQDLIINPDLEKALDYVLGHYKEFFDTMPVE